MQSTQSRRRFLASAAWAGAAGLIGAPKALHAEPPPETASVRLPRWGTGDYCWAAEYVAEELMHAEGITDVRYVRGQSEIDTWEWIAHGETDFDLNMPTMHIKSVDAGVPIKVLTGLHSGCFEVIANESVRNLKDLKGRRVGVWNMNDHPQVLLSLMINYVGLDPVNDIQWVESRDTAPMQLFIDGKVDAFLAALYQPEEMRARKLGHTIVSNGLDRAWSQYFCCMIAGTAEYVNKYPVATKRILRAILKGADLCASNPKGVARQLVDRGYLKSYDYAIDTFNTTRYDVWRDYDAEDSLRFYALRMQETGMIKSSPQKIIGDGTDWRFLDELKRELKA
jgi:NitT/TauT family transport system substrate-binding protein